jgi:predicted enzyme related to lactoylglutathione lyase
MSERSGYEPGVPCWVDTLQPDPAAAVGFYTALFGWEAQDALADSPGRYFLCELGGRDVAAVGAQQAAGAAPAWGTYVWVESAESSAARVRRAGGRVILEPFDSLDGGRMAIVADPAGAVFGVWQPGRHRGAERVNEPGAWSMSALSTPDPDGAKAFYGDVFGWETDTFALGGSEMTMWRLPGYVGGEPEQPVSREVVATMAPGGEAPHWSVDFWVADVDETAERAAGLGGGVVAPPYDIPEARFRQAVLADPQGAVFSVTRVRVDG